MNDEDYGDARWGLGIEEVDEWWRLWWCEVRVRFLMVVMKDDGDEYIVEDEQGLGMINGIEGCVMRVWNGPRLGFYKFSFLFSLDFFSL